MYSLKDDFYVSGVNCSCEMMEQRLWSFCTALIKQIDKKVLDVFKGIWITTKLWKIVTDVDQLDLFLKKISLIEEQDNWDMWKCLVVDDRLKYVARFQKTVCSPIFKENLVKLTWRRKKQDRSNIFKALEPSLALRPLSANIHKVERYTVYKELMFCDPFCSFACM